MEVVAVSRERLRAGTVVTWSSSSSTILELLSPLDWCLFRCNRDVGLVDCRALSGYVIKDALQRRR